VVEAIVSIAHVLGLAANSLREFHARAFIAARQPQRLIKPDNNARRVINTPYGERCSLDVTLP
jgi:hypothetical protein